MSLLCHLGENDTNEKKVKNKAGILEISRLRLAISLLWFLFWLFLAVFVHFSFPFYSPLCPVLCYFCFSVCLFYKRNRSVVLTGRIFKPTLMLSELVWKSLAFDFVFIRSVFYMFSYFPCECIALIKPL